MVTVTLPPGKYKYTVDILQEYSQVDFVVYQVESLIATEAIILQAARSARAFPSFSGDMYRLNFGKVFDVEVQDFGMWGRSLQVIPRVHDSYLDNIAATLHAKYDKKSSPL